MLSNLLHLILLLTVLPFVSPAAHAATDKGAAIAEIIRAYNSRGDFEGVVLVARDGKIVHRQAVGLANREWGIPHRENTLFRICSMTKQFTAMLVMQLVEAGKLRLDAPVTEYLPDLRQKIDSKVTLRSLLSSASGLPTFDAVEFWQKQDERLSSPKFVAGNFIGGPLTFEPGERFNYNNGDFILLGAVLEQVSGRTYEQLLREQILSPLGMKNTGLLKRETVIGNLANGYVRQNSVVLNEPYLHIQNYSSAGAMYSTVDDLLLWDTALLTDKLLSKRYADEMLTPTAKLGFVALGSWVYPLKLPSGKTFKLIERQGAIGGFCALNLLVPDERYALIFLSNTETDALFSTYMGKGLASDVLKAVLD